METPSTYPKSSFLRFLYTLVLVPLLLVSPGLVGDVMGQTKVFVKSIESQSNVDNANNVLVGQGSATESTFATVNSSTLIVNFAGYLEQDFEEILPANTTSYVRIGVDDAGLLNALLGGSLGDLLDDVLGVLLGNHSFEIDVKNSSGGSVLAGTSANSFQAANGRIRVVQNALGQFFLAITPDQPYSRIRVTDRTTGILGASDIDVYGAYYVENDDPCAPAFGTSFDGTGLTVDLLGIGGAGVTNPQFAIDSDPANFSEIAIGTAGIGASMFQTVYFNTVSAKEDYFKVTLAIANGGALTADLIGNIEIRAYNGAELVFSKKLQGGLVNGLDLLGLLQSGEPVTLPFGPGVEFDRVAIGYNSLISLSVLANSPIQLYSVERYGVGCPDPDPIVITPTDPMLIQKDCAAKVLSFEHANFPYNAVDGNNDTYVTLEASSGILLGGVLGEAYSGHVELEFNAPVTASKTVYVRIDFDEEQLGSLLDGSVGELLGGVVDGVLLGNHYFTIEAKNGAATILERSSNSGFNDALGTGIGEVKIVQDKNGHYYVAVTSDAPFQSIRITEHLSALVGAGTIEHMNVYHACFSTGAELCEQAFSTYSASDGISLDLLGVGSAGVTNAHLAIDDDDLSVEADETYSEIGIGTAGIGASTFQFVDFHTLSSPADYFKIKIGFENGSLLDVELLNNIEIRAYNGDDLVYSQRLQNGLVAGLDILGLLSTDNVVTIPIGPGKEFDRVAVGVSTLVDVNALSTPLRVYSIKRFGADCPDPNPLPDNPDTESPFNGPDCGISLGEFENVNFAYNAIDGDIDTYATLSAGSGVILGAGAYSSFIELGYDQPVPALETSYIRVDMADDGLLDALVGGSLGSLLADVGDIVIFGNHYFDISVRDAAGIEIYSESSSDGFENNNVRIVRDEFGRYYIAFTADELYQSVRITLNNTAVAGLDATTTMNVYSMCRETVFDPCEQATFTSFDGTGLTVNLLEGANPAGVINPQYVIDGNNSNYAEFSLGTAAIGAAIYQDIYFKTKVTTAATDLVRLRMQVPSSLLNVDLLGAYRIYLYNGDDEVYDATLQNALINGLDLLGLLNSEGRVNVEFQPGAGITYDRVRFEVSSVVGAGIGNPIRLYSVYRVSDACPDPEFETPPFELCADDVIGTAENVDDIQNLTDGNHNSYATIRSDAGLIAGIGAYSGHLELGFGAVVPAGTTSYIRIGYEEEILNALLAGSLGGLVNDLLNGVALGDHYFNVIINDGSGNPIANGSGSSQNLFADAAGQIRLVQDTKGRFYLAITPTVDYQSVRLEDHTTALLALGLSEGHLDVYGMCHTPTTFECPAPFSTSYEGSGLNLDALNLGGAGVQNAFRAIDQNTSGASTLSLGTAGVGGTIQQNIQFDRVLTAGTQINVRMKVGGGTLNASVLSTLEVIGYLNGTEVFSGDFNQAFVEANIADLLNASDPANVNINLGVDVDEIAFRLSGLLAVGVAPNVMLYHVAVECIDPVFISWKSFEIDGDPVLTSVSGGETVEYTIHVQNTGTVPMADFIITDEIPGNTTLVASSISDGGTETSDVITWGGINVPVGGTVTVSFSVTVDEDLSGVDFISNVALVKADGDDPGTPTWPPVDNENPTDPDDAGDTGTDIPVDHIAPILEITEDNAIADGVDENVLTATVQTEGGKLIEGQDVVFNITYPDGTEETQTIATNTDGQAVLEITSTTAGAAVVEAVVRGTEIEDSPATVTFVAGPVDHGESLLEVIKDGAIANGTDYNEVMATIVDANGNPIAGEDVVFDVTYPDATTDQQTVTTDAGGKAVLQITSSTAGDAEVVATVGGTEITGSPAKVSFVADVIDNVASTLVITKDGATADGVDYNELLATIVDGTNNPLDGVGVFFEIIYPNGSTDTESILTNAAGEAVLQLKSLVPGNAIVSATISGTDITGSPATVTFIACVGQPEITFDGDGTICEGEGLLLTATEADGYQWYLDGGPITDAIERTHLATEEGTYTVIVFGENDCQSEPSDPAVVTVNPAPVVTIDGETSYVIEIGGSVTLPGVEVEVDGSVVTSDITWLDPDGNEVPSPATTVGPFAEPGTYVYTVTAEVGNCSAMAAITIVVIDPDECPPGYERIYVSSSDSPSGVSNPGNAVGADLTDRAEVAIPSLFGTTTFNLSFDEALTGGEALHVKIGSRVDLSLVGSVSVTLQALDGATAVGTPVTLSGGWLVNLLAGENIDDIVLTNPGASYDGVRVTVQGGLLAAGDIDVYAAYANRKVVELADCEEVSDILTGSTSGALGAVNGVTNEWAVTNDDLSDFAVIRQNVGALGYVHLTTVYPSVAQSNDSVRIVMKRSDAGLIDAGVLDGIWIVAYNGNTAVQETQISGALLDLKLLTGSTDWYEGTLVIDAPFDRLQIRAGGVASALQGVDVAHIQRIAAINVANPGLPDGTFEICQGAELVLNGDDCGTVYEWYEELTGGTPIGEEGLTFTVPTDWAPGEHTIYVQPKRFGCDFGGRIPITIIVLESPTADDITIDADKDIYCVEDAAVLTATAVAGIADPQFSWFFDADKLEPIADGDEVDGATYTIVNGELTVAGLTVGDHTYYVSVRDGADGCENAAGDLATITVTVDETLPPALTELEQIFCEIDMPTVADLNDTGATGEVVWYAAATGGTPLAATDALAAGTYYAAQIGDNCESVDRTAVEVTITKTPAPTLTELAQVFCEIDMPTVADLATDGATGTVVWYDSETGTTPLDAATALIDGLYYAAQVGDNCESVDRTAVEVTITKTPAPSLTELAQIFCEIDMPTVADLNNVGATGEVVWYDSETSTTPLDPATALVDGMYYAAQVGDNCESVDRTEVEVTITKTPAPSLTELAQIFCEIDMPTVADLNTDGATGTVVWYAAATGGTPLVATDALADGMYYAAQVGDNCESVDRTEVEVTITKTPAPTLTNLDQIFCEIDMPTVADLNTGGATGTVVWYAAATGGTPLAATDALTDGMYYAAQVGDNCESVDRTEVEVTITKTPAPTLTELAQIFCEIDMPTVADLNTDGATGTVVWYAAATGGTPLAATDALADGMYYAAQIGDNCESVDRTEVEVIITKTLAPTIDNATPEFCETDNKTLADLLVVGTDIKWYASATSTDVLPETTVLEDGITYYATQTGDNCESADRLEVTPVINDCTSLLSITKTADADRATAGESISFTLTITNDGPGAMHSGDVIKLGERPSAGLTITGYEVTSGNGTASGTGNTATVTTNTMIPVGGTITLAVTADVDVDAPETVGNGIDVWGPDKDPETDPKDDDDDTPPIPVDRVSNLSITKVADDARVKAGESTSFTLTITNDGPSVIEVGKDINLTERPGDGVTITGYEVTSGAATVASDGNAAVLTTTGTIAIGGTVVVKVTADVAADAGETITNGITVWGPDKDPETDPEDDKDDTPPIPVDHESILSITKVADDDRVVAGGSTSFTLTITNDGPAVVASGEVISLTERPGDGVTITGYEVTSGNGTADGSGNTATITTGSVIAVGGTIVVKVTADVAADAGETITNGIDVWGPDKDPETDPKDDEDDTPPIPVDRESNLSITKVADEARVKAGESTSFTLTITNDGPSVIEVGKDINLTERPGDGVTITGYEVTSGAATVAGDGNTAVVTTTGKIAVGGTIVVQVTADIAANAGETITNGITVWGPDKDPGTDPEDDEDDTPPIPVDHEATLSITKVADEARVQAGESTSFTLTITNNGPAVVASGKVISLTERPGTGVTITGYEVTSGNGTAEGSGNTATVTTSEAVAVGGTIVVKVTADVAADAGETITNGITVWGPDKDPETDPEDDEDDTPPIPVDHVSVLSITKVADDERVIAGGTTSFTVTVTNNGPATIAVGETIAVEERPSDGVTVTGYEVTAGNATVSGTGNSPQLTTMAAIDVGGTITFTVSADVTAPAGSTISNGIAVWGPDKDPGTDPEDDEAETPEIPVDRPYTLSIEKVADQSLVTAGEATTFTVTVTNNGPLEIQSGAAIALRERPGTGVTITGYEIISGAATVSGTGNTATLTTTGVVGVGATISVRITADVAETATGTITNGISVWGPDSDPGTDEPDDEDDIDPVPVDATLHIPNVFTPNGDGLNDRFVIKNLQQYQGRELTVINRWGNQVYKSANYNNDWDGGSLAEGTYYFILRYRNGGDWKTAKGPVAIIRVTNR